MINWKVRMKNKIFWISLIPLVLLLIQQIGGIFGMMIDLSELGEKLIAVIGTLFGILALIGVVADPTTKGIGDSDLALTYEEPKENAHDDSRY